MEEARRPVDNSRTVRSQRIGGWSEGALSLFPLLTDVFTHRENGAGTEVLSLRRSLLTPLHFPHSVPIGY